MGKKMGKKKGGRLMVDSEGSSANAGGVLTMREEAEVVFGI